MLDTFFFIVVVETFLSFDFVRLSEKLIFFGGRSKTKLEHCTLNSLSLFRFSSLTSFQDPTMRLFFFN